MAKWLMKTIKLSGFWDKQVEMVVRADTEEEAREDATEYAREGNERGTDNLGWMNDTASSCDRVTSHPGTAIVASWEPRD